MVPLKLFWVVVWLLQTAAGQPAAPAEPGRFHGFPGYPGASFVEFQGDMRSNDVPLEATVVVTGDPVKAVIQHYHRHLESMHIVGTEHWLGPDSAYIGFFDPSSQTMRLVTTVGTPSDGTMVIFSSMDPRSLLKKPGRIPADLPAVAGASRVTTTESRDGGHRHRSVNFLLQGKTPAQAREEFTRVLLLKGWQQVQDASAGEGNTAFRQGGLWCILRVGPAKGGSQEPAGSSVTIMVTDRLP